MAWVSALADQDAWSVLLILVDAGIYLGALLAVGSVLFRFVFRGGPDRAHQSARRMGALAAAAALVLLLLKWPLQAGFLGGGTLSAATDPMLLMMLLDGAFGIQLLLMAGGLVVLQFGLLRVPLPMPLRVVAATAGCALVLSAFVQVGHTVREPRTLLMGLLMLHLLCVAFWLAALPPLHQVSYGQDRWEAAAILRRFGQLATFAVGVLVVAGVALAWQLLGGLQPLLTTAYGQVLLGKVSAVGLLLLFAAMNKLWLVPAFENAAPAAPLRLRRSIRIEAVIAILIVLITALLTSVGTPGA
ncbi:copper resistance D family protein [Alkalilimnicola ehrlichii MLHE-1]|uniref:Copper resistance protein D n=1 Tax=Alkalilimnicola ehrlichii (strain ATCC BAA-1101 / DSM 17681 / MLHE-1) TaxID=187272 RepID=Q0ABD5_ALKEH|nr:CopD family protein [Alkalilimnicola ehrlichii]ABI55852.1 copper resistance D domain protein [Alkalilimnicola ehrlichii MLHE-1]